MGYRTLEESEAIVTPLDAEIVADVFTPIVQMILGKRETTIVWPTTVFLSGDKPNQPASLIATQAYAIALARSGEQPKTARSLLEKAQRIGGEELRQQKTGR